MKKTVFSFGLALSLIACSNNAPVDYALVTGKIDNLEAKEVTLVKSDQSFKKEITIESNGVFTDTIKAGSGLYELVVGKNRTNIYLDNGNVINLTADAKAFNSSLDISGKGAETTNYILYKNKKEAALKTKDRAVYKLEEPDFKVKFKEIENALNARLDTTQGITPAFKTLEKRNLNYEYLNELERYAGGYHRQWAQKKGYRPSEEFLAELEGVDLDNDVDFFFSSAYKEMVNRHYTKQINVLHREDSLEYGLRAITIYATVPNEIIRNELIFSKAEYDLYQTVDFEEFHKIFMSASTNEENNAKITKIYNDLMRVNKGQPSPKFIDYEKHSGGTLSLDELKGKYIYIDVWATWCGPCLAELPDLQRIEKDYHGKNITFLSISIDQAKDHDKWKDMVVDKKLGGIQILADKAFDSQFVLDYNIRSIPRFIVLDPNGVIVSPNAPKPSDPELINLFNELNI
ncbi:TlpA family protein disulfide reductase [Algibacter miyuki]|uniref:TlpA family protein disulfide reductase n=1 Tax=Algibacter miyuki TaxID=1306933 RepID=A0ABV5H2P2_9FLAO|nr:TlpA disulfide reductase family protein [Algibacter miyuki]MDN3663856.1 TlpA disulfide reductase family protein [Algibacter miyuki]